MGRLYENKSLDSKPDSSRVWLGWMPGKARALVLRLIRSLESLWRYWSQIGLRQDVRRKQQIMARLARSLTLGLFSFEFNQIPVRSAALTYTTILGVVPLVVILSAVAGRFGYLGMLERFIPFVFESLNLDFPLDPIFALLHKAEGVNFQALGLLGSAGLLISFYLAMDNIELAIGHIWNIRKARGVWASIKAYAPFLLLLMIMVGLLGHVLIRFRDLVDVVDFTGIIPTLRHGAALVIGTSMVTAFIWVALVLILFIVPNTKVRLSAAMIGASITTLLLFGLTRLFFFFPHILYSRNNVVLGSLAFVPAMLVFVYVVWLLILYGASVAFIYQKLFRENQDLGEASDEDLAFAEMEGQVLALLSAIHQDAGDVEIPLAAHGDENAPVAFKESKAVWAQALSERLHLSLESIDKAALPLQDLGWIRRRQTEGGAIYILKRDPDNMDLLALHGLLVRINPQGTGFLRQLNMLEEIHHTLSLLYSKSKDHPPLSLQTARGWVKTP